MQFPPLVRVVLWMLGTLLSFSAMAVSIRELSATLSIMEILSTRSAIALLILGALMAARPQLRHAINRARLPLHVLRNGIHFGSQYLWSTSLLLLPPSTPHWRRLPSSTKMKPGVSVAYGPST